MTDKRLQEIAEEEAIKVFDRFPTLHYSRAGFVVNVAPFILSALQRVREEEKILGEKEADVNTGHATRQNEVALGFVIEAACLLQEIGTSKLRALGCNSEPIALTRARLKLINAMSVLDDASSVPNANENQPALTGASTVNTDNLPQTLL